MYRFFQVLFTNDANVATNILTYILSDTIKRHTLKITLSRKSEITDNLKRWITCGLIEYMLS